MSEFVLTQAAKGDLLKILEFLEAVRGEVVTLIDDEVPVPIDTVVDHALLDQALNDGHVENAVGRVPSTTDAADGLPR